MKKSLNKIKNILKIGLLSLLGFTFLLGGISYGTDDLLFQLMEPAFNNQTVINAGKNTSRVGQNFFKGAFEISIDVQDNPPTILTDNGSPICGSKVEGSFYLNGSLKSGSSAVLMTGKGAIGEVIGSDNIKEGNWLIGAFDKDDIDGEVIPGIFIMEKSCSDDCKKSNEVKSECLDEWIIIDSGNDFDLGVSRKPSIIVKATRLLLMLVITLSVTMILYNGMTYIIQTGQGKEGKSLVKNIIYIVIGIILSLFSVIIITLIQSVPTTLDSDLSRVTAGDSIDDKLLEKRF